MGPSSLHVNHLNGVRCDNRIGNLEYCTNAQNVRHAVKHLPRPDRKGSKNQNAKVSEADVVAIVDAWKAGATVHDLASLYGTAETTISLILRGKSWAHVEREIIEEPAPKAVGQHHPRTSLTNEDVRRIRRLVESGKSTQAELRQEYGLSRGAMSSLVNRRTWKSVA